MPSISDGWMWKFFDKADLSSISLGISIINSLMIANSRYDALSFTSGQYVSE